MGDEPQLEQQGIQSNDPELWLSSTITWRGILGRREDGVGRGQVGPGLNQNLNPEQKQIKKSARVQSDPWTTRLKSRKATSIFHLPCCLIIALQPPSFPLPSPNRSHPSHPLPKPAHWTLTPLSICFMFRVKIHHPAAPCFMADKFPVFPKQSVLGNA